MGIREVKVDGTCVDVRFLVMGPLKNNVYIVSDGRGTMVVDPSAHADVILQQLGGAPLDAIVVTHSHWDHTGAAAELREATGAPVIASAVEADYVENPREGDTSHVGNPCKVDRTVSSGDVVQVGGMRWKVIETPGHSSGSICLFCIPQFGNHADGCPVLISGDTLFAGTCGRTDFERGSASDMVASMKRLAMLPDDTVALPGHGALTTIGAERGTFARFGWEPDD